MLQSVPKNMLIVAMQCMWDQGAKEKVIARRELARLFGVAAYSQREALSPYLGRTVAALLRRLRDADVLVNMLILCPIPGCIVCHPRTELGCRCERPSLLRWASLRSMCQCKLKEARGLQRSLNHCSW